MTTLTPGQALAARLEQLAAAAALGLLEQERGAVDATGAARELHAFLRTCPDDQGQHLLWALASLVGRLGVLSPDVATMKVHLRTLAKDNDLLIVEGLMSKPATGRLD